MPRVQAFEHDPQCSTVVRSVSQPSKVTPLQSPNPESQLRRQRLRAHTATPRGPDGTQALPQPPQLAAEDLRLTSHPLAGFMSQLPNPSVHAPSVHRPPTHAPVPPSDTHVFPHLPQFIAFVCVSTSQPLVVSRSQFKCPDKHAPKVHTPPTHELDAPSNMQTFPQPPQLAMSDDVVTQRPAQSVCPVGHTKGASIAASGVASVATSSAASTAASGAAGASSTTTTSGVSRVPPVSRATSGASSLATSTASAAWASSGTGDGSDEQAAMVKSNRPK